MSENHKLRVHPSHVREIGQSVRYLTKLPTYLPKELSKELSHPLWIYNKSKKEGILPSQWIEACITAIHKKDAQSNVGNYRPVSLTSVICKIIESIIMYTILEYMVRNSLFSHDPHGFVPQRDCMTNLLLTIETLTNIMEDGGAVDIIYTDFAKAFDSVPHKRIISKVNTLGIKGDILQWIQSLLIKRKQRVVVEGKPFSWENVIGGIPQGTFFGPLIFVIYINDLTNDLTSMTKLFADNTKVYREVETLTTWSRVWQLPFNTTKCKRMHFGKKHQHYKYRINEHTLEEVEVEKDLGVIVDKESFAIKKDNTILGLIKIYFAVFDHKRLPKLFKYGDVVWGPHFKFDQQAIERVQKRATKLFHNIKDLPYSERLDHLRLPSLAYYRRRRDDMLQTYKIISDEVNIYKNIIFQFRAAATREHKYKIYEQRATKLPIIQRFSKRIVSDWNRLPPEVVDSMTMNEFKKRIDDFWIYRKFETPFT